LKKDRHVKISTEHVELPANPETIKDKIAEVPVAIAVYASNWSNYKSGLYKCGFYVQVNHAVTAIGYESDHYIVRNSWGTGWGEKGHIRLSSSASSYDDCGARKYAKAATLTE